MSLGREVTALLSRFLCTSPENPQKEVSQGSGVLA